MGKGFKARSGGGNPLNFKVVGGTSAPALPKENMIWINTSVAVSGWEFSAIQPTGEAGKVWIVTGASVTATFNALKKNAITICPISAKQYVSGAWVDKTAKIYQGGEWADFWNGELYDSGNEFTNITGGWTTVNTSANHTAGGKLTKNADHMFVQNYENGSNVAVTTNKIDLTNYNELHCIFSGISAVLRVGLSYPGNSAASKTVSGDSTHAKTTEGVLDISSVNDSMFVCVGDGNIQGIRVYKVWLV